MLTYKLELDGATLAIVLDGMLSEDVILDDLFDRLQAHAGPARIDVHGVRRINSMGVKVWVAFVERLGHLPTPARITLSRCSVSFVGQLNMVRGVMGALGVASVAVPYLCPACDEVAEVVVDVDRGPPVLVPPPCAACGQMTELDASEEQYFTFLAERRA